MSLFSDLVAKANLIKNETVDEANSADRIGQMFIDLINFAAATSGIKKGMTIEWDLNLGPIPTGFVLADGYGGIKCNGVTVPDKRDRFEIGYNPAKFPLPLNTDGLVENYGKIGNTGGTNWYKLTGKQSGIQKHRHTIAGTDGNDQSSTKGREMNPNPDSLEDYGNKTRYVDHADALDDHDNRPQYIVVCKITKVSDDYTAEYNSAWHSYLDTTTDDPKLSEADWVKSLKGAEQDLSALATKIALEFGLQQKVDKVPGKSLIADTEITRLAGVSNVDISGKENVGVASQLITDLKAGVPTAGDTLLKLFNEIGLKINRSETLTATEIQLLISNLVDSAPETLNTLHELANALGDDPNFATTISTLIGTKLNASKAAIESLLTGLISSHYHTAAATPFVPTATITATDVQSAIESVEANANGKISPKPAAEVTPYTIGQAVEGGVVFYILQTGDFGYDASKQKCLIVSLTTQQGNIRWWDGEYSITGALDTAIGYGRINTDKILSIQAGELVYAAKFCTNSVEGGYGDWYIGSQAEMLKLYENKALTSLSNLDNNYWTSSEVSETNVSVISSSGAIQSIDKSLLKSVRAIRMSVIDLNGYSIPVDGEIIVASGNSGKEVKGSGILVSQLIIQTRIYQKSFTDDSPDGVMNPVTYINEGKSEFALPVDMDLTHDYTIYDGGVMVEPSINLVARTAIFDVVPLAMNGTKKNKLTYKYYPIIN